MQTNFCGCLEKLFILNPSSSLSFSWKMISALGDPDSMAKISFRKPKEYVKMQEKIPANQLEQQYGGTIPDLKRFW
jgi:CRAL/TRIO domain